jgi:hypothetical protein
VSRSVKLFIEEFAHHEQLEISIQGEQIHDKDVFCTDPMPPRHEVNFRIPAGIPPGAFTVDLRYHSRRFPPLAFELADIL